MSSYEKAGQPGYQDLSFDDRELGNRAGKFPKWTLQPGYQDEIFFQNTLRERTATINFILLLNRTWATFCMVIPFVVDRRNIRQVPQSS